MIMATNDTGRADDRLEEVIAEYLRGVDEYRRGVKDSPPDREALLAQHSDLAVELRDFFADYDQIERKLHPVRGGDIPAHADLPRPAPGWIHYFGDYELLSEVARGGMGAVYRARQVSLNRPVALKMILAGRLATEADVARFRREAEAAANLHHPGIVPIYEIGEHQGQHYFSMELVEGPSLAQILAEAGSPLPPRRAAEVIRGAADAVHHAHQRGILHWDLKPSNIILDGKGNPHLTDFGLARRLGSRDPSVSGVVAGSPSYMAPEQAAGSRERTTATDVYGLGATLYALLAGRAPFLGESVPDTLRRVCECAPEPPSRVNRRVPRDLEVICLKCLEKEPGRRYGSAEALAEDLERWLRGEPIAARPVGPIGQLLRWCRRKPVPAAAVLAVVVTAIVAFVAITLSRNDLRRQRDIARSRELAATAISELQVDPERSLRLATQAARIARTGQAEHALRTSLILLC
jgi:serine/threonine-protein kinase